MFSYQIDNLISEGLYHMLSAARIATQALGLTPLGKPWTGASGELTCSLECRPIEHGEPVIDWKAGANFMDDAKIARTGLISGWVAPLLTKKVMSSTQAALFCAEGAFKLGRDVWRAWAFLTPPKPPYVMVLGDSKMQHLIWRAPVTLSNDLVRFQLGARSMMVRRRRLIDAMDRLRALDGPAFQVLDREGLKHNHGELRSDCPPELARVLADLTPGEIVALAVLAKATRIEPETPPLINLDEATDQPTDEDDE